MITMITNLFQAAHERAVLVNYTTYPFLHRPGGHPNHYESHLIARAFHDLGYRVDVADYDDDSPIDLTPYDLIFGFGQAFERSFTAAHRPGLKRINYATGAHVSHQNPAEIARVRAVNRRHGTRLLPRRVVPWCWSLSTSFSDAGATSLLTAMATGLVPIGTRWTGVDVDRLGIEMDEISAAAVDRAVDVVRGMAPAALASRDRALRAHCLANHSPPAFAAAFRRLIADCLA